MNNKAFLNIYKNPIVIFGVVILILTAILYSGTKFEFPDYYTNRALADELAQNVMPNDVEKTVKYLINPLYKIYNFLYHIWAIFIALFIFSVIFRIYKFSSCKELKIFNNKLFVYIWANLSYIIFGICSYYSAIAEIKKYVYNGMADSFGIIYLLFHIIPFLIAIFYYPIINILLYLTYNLKNKNYFINFFWYLCLIIIFYSILCNLDSQFIYLDILMYLYAVFWLMTIINIIKYYKNKHNY